MEMCGQDTNCQEGVKERFWELYTDSPLQATKGTYEELCREQKEPSPIKLDLAKIENSKGFLEQYKLYLDQYKNRI